MDQDAFVRSPASEEEYQAWVLGNPYGYVINASRVPAQVPSQAQGMTWHHANCVTIDPTRYKRLVTGSTMKACSPSPAALAVWAVERGEDMQYCSVCCRKWRTALSGRA